MVVSSLPDRPLTLSECDDLRQSDRITQLASVPTESGDVGLLFLLSNDVMTILTYHTGRGWTRADRRSPVDSDDFEAAIEAAGNELGLGIRERDRRGVERDL